MDLTKAWWPNDGPMIAPLRRLQQSDPYWNDAHGFPGHWLRAAPGWTWHSQNQVMFEDFSDFGECFGDFWWFVDDFGDLLMIFCVFLMMCGVFWWFWVIVWWFLPPLPCQSLVTRGTTTGRRLEVKTTQKQPTDASAPTSSKWEQDKSLDPKGSQRISR